MPFKPATWTGEALHMIVGLDAEHAPVMTPSSSRWLSPKVQTLPSACSYDTEIGASGNADRGSQSRDRGGREVRAADDALPKSTPAGIAPRPHRSRRNG